MVADARVYEELKANILRGDYSPRQRLVEAELCEEFEASRFAVRAALQSLEADGLVERQRNRGARIREISLEEAVEITEVRMVVEGLVARRAAERVTDAQAATLREIGAAMRVAVASGDVGAYGDLNVRLHQTVREIASHAKATGIIARLHGQMIRHQFAMSRLPGRSSVSVVQHEAIIDAIAARDPDAAESAMRAHIASVIEALRTIAEADVRRG
ncbi:GntR family transcriptional regulator [Demequina sp. SYSU T00039]|uniref:GntR family transcriptional regulator n=1 Tax=Demequina lignilytica TaxID=3051663 RepID=A0AAW7M329_9MICO|nr:MULTISPECIES: GntR family transcriptional regulator [unclassified Demequina]MDN4477535.1 GntR family transcriptional regulator [Demequina sp. SYSU T00039-1]MDN4488114.1 GntR family transcriptional regulator [Demequina sp. SYSU T00039]MDN4490555.1 GntR family transcriptional regulator [Demequina sp. SYSU T00068]